MRNAEQPLEPVARLVNLRERTRAFGRDVIRLSASLPRGREADVLARQVVRAGTSVGAQYHEATRARSGAEFVSKLEAATQELEETGYWIDLLLECNFVAAESVVGLRREVDELLAVFIASINTVKRRRNTKEAGSQIGHR